MKKTMVILLTCSSLLFSEKYHYSGVTIDTQVLNEALKVMVDNPIEIYFSDKTFLPIIYGQDLITKYKVFINEKSRDSLLNILIKYTNWVDIAVKNKTQVRKGVGQILLSMQWQMGEKTYNAENVKFLIMILSQSISYHPMGMSIDNAIGIRKKKHVYVGNNNEYDEFNADDLYFKKKQVIQLINQLKKGVGKKFIDIENAKISKQDKLFK